MCTYKSFFSVYGMQMTLNIHVSRYYSIFLKYYSINIQRVSFVLWKPFLSSYIFVQLFLINHSLLILFINFITFIYSRCSLHDVNLYFLCIFCMLHFYMLFLLLSTCALLSLLSYNGLRGLFNLWRTHAINCHSILLTFSNAILKDLKAIRATS